MKRSRTEDLQNLAQDVLSMLHCPIKLEKMQPYEAKGPLQNSFSDYVKNASLTYIWKALTTRNTQDGEK